MFKSSFFNLPGHRKFDYISRTEEPVKLHTSEGDSRLHKGFISTATTKKAQSPSRLYRLLLIILILVVPSALLYYGETMYAIVSMIPLCWLLFKSIKSQNG